jgi:hypothetical protein
MLVYLFLGLLFISCEKVVTDVSLPDVESQYVVFSFISPEEKNIIVDVSQTRPVRKSGLNSGTLSNAFITILNSLGQKAVIPFVDSLNTYVLPASEYPIKAGETYRIEVAINGKRLTGSCQVPADSVSISEKMYVKLGEASAATGGPYYKYTYKWQDIPTVVNYYRVDIEKQSRYIQDADTIVNTETVCNTTWSDEGRQGVRFTGVCEDYSDSKDLEIRIFLLNTDVHYYEYHRRRLNYYGDDPFSEPFQQYTNMEGGLGVFGAYRKTVRSLELK